MGGSCLRGEYDRGATDVLKVIQQAGLHHGIDCGPVGAKLRLEKLGAVRVLPRRGESDSEPGLSVHGAQRSQRRAARQIPDAGTAEWADKDVIAPGTARFS